MLNKDLIDITHIMGDGEAEIIPLLTEEDTKDLTVTDMPEQMPILPLRGNVFFPGVVLPITAGREKSVRLINSIQKQGYYRSGGTMCCRYRRPRLRRPIYIRYNGESVENSQYARWHNHGNIARA